MTPMAMMLMETVMGIFGRSRDEQVADAQDRLAEASDRKDADAVAKAITDLEALGAIERGPGHIWQVPPSE
jgi:hypothetical protein